MISKVSSRPIISVLLVSAVVAVELLTWSRGTQLRGGPSLPAAAVPVLTVAVYSLLLLRWRRVVAVFVLQWLYSLSGLVLPGFNPVAGLLVSLHSVACRLGGRGAGAALAACAIPFAGGAWYGASTRENQSVSGALSFAIQFFLYALLAVTIWTLGRRSHSAERHSTRLIAEQQAAVERAIAAERTRLARELHDIVTSAVTVMLFQAAGAKALLGDGNERVRRALSTIESSGIQTMRELHRMLELLRSVDESSEAGLEPPGLRDLPQLLHHIRAADVAVTLTDTGTPQPLDRSIDLAAYRVVQEALTNATKHGGQRPRAEITLDWRQPSQVAVTIASTNGPDASNDELSSALSMGQGLRGLAERVGLVGGHLTAAATHDGYVVRASLPTNSNPRSSSDNDSKRV